MWVLCRYSDVSYKSRFCTTSLSQCFAFLGLLLCGVCLGRHLVLRRSLSISESFHSGLKTLCSLLHFWGASLCDHTLTPLICTYTFCCLCAVFRPPLMAYWQNKRYVSLGRCAVIFCGSLLKQVSLKTCASAPVGLSLWLLSRLQGGNIWFVLMFFLTPPTSALSKLQKLMVVCMLVLWLVQSSEDSHSATLAVCVCLLFKSVKWGVLSIFIVSCEERLSL